MTTPFTRNVVILKGDPIIKEAVAAEAVTPGQLIERMTTGKIQRHNTAGGNAIPAFAVEQDYLGKTMDEACAADDRIPFAICKPGDEVNALLKAGENVAIGAPLESDGDGGLKAHTALVIDQGGAGNKTVYTRPIVAYALEAKDNSAGAAAVRIQVEVA